MSDQKLRLNGPMVAKLRLCAADTSPNWDGKITIYPPEARELVALIDAATRTESEDEDDHPERECQRCGRSNVRAWSAPSPLWNQVMRGGDINGKERFGGIVCPVCFAALAEEAGIAQRWRFYAEKVHAELATVTPSGRVWNPETWLWDEAPRPPAAEGSGTTHE